MEDAASVKVKDADVSPQEDEVVQSLKVNELASPLCENEVELPINRSKTSQLLTYKRNQEFQLKLVKVQEFFGSPEVYAPSAVPHEWPRAPCHLANLLPPPGRPPENSCKIQLQSLRAAIRKNTVKAAITHESLGDQWFARSTISL